MGVAQAHPAPGACSIRHPGGAFVGRDYRRAGRRPLRSRLGPFAWAGDDTDRQRLRRSPPVHEQHPRNRGAADTCLAASTTTVALAIVPTHWTYTLTIESSTVTFGSVVFQVKTGAGAVANPAGAGGFYVVNITGNVVACVLPVATNGGLTMGGAAQFTYISATGITPSSSLTNLYTIVIDVGTARPTGSGYTFDALGQGSYSGVTGPLMLP